MKLLATLWCAALFAGCTDDPTDKTDDNGDVDILQAAQPQPLAKPLATRGSYWDVTDVGRRPKAEFCTDCPVYRMDTFDQFQDILYWNGDGQLCRVVKEAGTVIYSDC